MEALNKKEAKQILEQLENARQQIARVDGFEQKTTIEIKTLSRLIRDNTAKESLKQIPIDELNSNGEGIKLASLREAGYETLHDLEGKSPRELMKIPGIGETQAMRIASKIRYIQDANRDTSNLTIDFALFDEVKQIRDLVYNLHLLIGLGDILAKAKPISSSLGKTMLDHYENAKAATRFSFKMLFAKREQKDKCSESLEILLNLYGGGICDEVKKIHSEFESRKTKLSHETARAAFKANNAAFYALLEKLVPETLVKTEQEVLGLPAEIYERINYTKLNVDTLNATLRSYQEFGTKYILNQQRVLLGDEMGLGKTMQALACMAHLRKEGCKHFMVVCPVSVLVNWQREISKFLGETAIAIHGTDRMDEYNEWLSNGGICVTTFETIVRLEINKERSIDMLIVDEAHYVKNPEAKRTIALKEVIENSEYCLLMTGTPLENKVEEMIFLVSLLRPSVAKDIEKFKELRKAPQFREVIAPVYLRRNRIDVLKELPELIEKEEWCILGEVEKKEYIKSLAKKNMMKMRQVSYEVENSADSSKINRLIEICDEAKEDGRKVIIFSYFLSTIAKIQAALMDRCYGVITGAINSNARQEIIDGLAKAPDGSVVVSQITAGGVGLNIQCASVVILCEPQWKPSIEDQAISRCYRMGQSQSVMVHRLLAENTVDERIVEILKDKSEIFEGFAFESEIDSISKKMKEDIIAKEREFYNVTDGENEEAALDEGDMEEHELEEKSITNLVSQGNCDDIQSLQMEQVEQDTM